MLSCPYEGQDFQKGVSVLVQIENCSQMRENYKSWTINCEQPTITRLEKGYLLEASSWRLDIEYIINDVII